MKITVINDYSRKGNLVNIRFKIETDTLYTDGNNEQYNEGYAFTGIRYIDNKWVIESKFQHDGYPIDEYNQITDTQLIEVFTSSELYKRVKKSMKI